MSMKVLPNQKKHHCHRERCLGDAKDYQNYIPHPSNSKKKNNRPNTTRSQHSLHQLKKPVKAQPKAKLSKKSLLQKSQLQDLKRRNEDQVLRNGHLSDQLQEKSRKINELKHRVKDYQSKIKGYEQKVSQLQSIINESQHPKSPISHDKTSQYLMASYQQQLKTFETNQKAMLEHMEKYRIVEKEYQQYRNESESKIQKLLRQNEQLRQFQSHQKQYDGELDQLRRELNRMSPQLSPQYHSKSISTSLQENEIVALKATNRQLMLEREHLLCKIEEQAVKEGQLRHNLEAINRRVQRWEHQYQGQAQERKDLQDRLAHLERKMQQKKEKHSNQKDEWARIFRQLMYQIQKLKREIVQLERSNNELKQIYAEDYQ